MTFDNQTTMITIRELLNKIRWDEQEDSSQYEIYYLDRVENILKKIYYEDIVELEGLFMDLLIEDKLTSVPLHRIKVVKKDDIVVWKRDY